MGYEWRYEDEQHAGFEFDDGTVDLWIADHNGVAQMQRMPYAEFQAMVAVMREEYLAWQAELEKRPGAKLVREVLALSGLHHDELAGLFGHTGVNTVRLWLVGSDSYKLYKERLLRLKEAFAEMEFDPHLGRRQAVFRGASLSLYERLRRELPEREPLWGTRW